MSDVRVTQIYQVGTAMMAQIYANSQKKCSDSSQSNFLTVAPSETPKITPWARVQEILGTSGQLQAWSRGLKCALKEETVTRTHTGPAHCEPENFLNTAVSPLPCL